MTNATTDEGSLYKKTYLASTPEDVDKVAAFMLAIQKGTDQFLKLDLPLVTAAPETNTQHIAPDEALLHEKLYKDNIRITGSLRSDTYVN